MKLAPLIDHTLLKSTATAKDIEMLCADATTWGVATVCVASRWVHLASHTLQNCNTKVCSVINFPLGNSSGDAVVAEAELALSRGAVELDTLLPLGDFLAGNDKLVVKELSKLTSLGVPIKVILETCLLSDEQIIKACKLCRESGAAFVKTSTGFSTGGATVHHVALMSRYADGMGVKASGGISSREFALELVAAGATRLGASKTKDILQGELPQDHR